VAGVKQEREEARGNGCECVQAGKTSGRTVGRCRYW